MVVRDARSLPQVLAAVKAAQRTGQSLYLATVSVSASGVASIQQGGVTLAGVQWAYQPADGDTVLVAQIAGIPVAVGALTASPVMATATVTAAPTNSATITVNPGDGSSRAMPFLSTYTPVVGDVVEVAMLGSQPIVLGKPGKTGTPPPAPIPQPTQSTSPPPPRPPQTGITTFPPVGSGTYRDGSGWIGSSLTSGHVLQGDAGFGMNSGAWFSGRQPNFTLKGAAITRCQVLMGRPPGTGASFAAQAVHLCRVANNVQPAGALTFDTAHAVDVMIAAGQVLWVDIPASIGQALVDSGGSIGVQGANPYLHLYSAGQQGCGAVKLWWSK